MTDLVALEDAMEFLKITQAMPAADEDRLMGSIAAVSALVESRYRPLASMAYENLRLAAPAGCALYPPRAPIDVTATITLTINGVVQSVWTAEGDGDPTTFDVMVASTVGDSPFMPDSFHRRVGWGGDIYGGLTGWNPRPILLSYTGGFTPSTLPADLKRAVLETVLTLYRDVQQGTVDLAATGAPMGGTTWELPRWMPYRARQVFESHALVQV